MDSFEVESPVANLSQLGKKYAVAYGDRPAGLDVGLTTEGEVAIYYAGTTFDATGIRGAGASATVQAGVSLVPSFAAGGIAQRGGGFNFPKHVCAWKEDGAAYCWGQATSGATGTEAGSSGLAVNVPWPVKFPAVDTKVKSMCTGPHFSAAVSTSGEVFVWGAKSVSQIAGGGTDQPYPVALSTLSGPSLVPAATSVSCGTNHICALAGGGVYCWGANARGQLGQGTYSPFASPAPVLGLSDVVGVTAGADVTCAWRADGSMACFGDDEHGLVGSGNLVSQVVPLAVVGLD